RAEPVVGGGEKLDALLVRLRAEGGPLRREDLHVHEIAGRLAGERGAVVQNRAGSVSDGFLRVHRSLTLAALIEQLAVIDEDAARRGEAAFVQGRCGPVLADRIDLAAT